jgi:polyphosphate kinase 2 (PPK2 family)
MSKSAKASKDGNGKMKRKLYEKELRKLQVELCHVQDWVKEKGQRVIILFEGRDAAGKGGTIKALTERVSPRVFRVVALPAPSDREKTQMFLQRYVEHFPAAGEIVITQGVRLSRRHSGATILSCRRNLPLTRAHQSRQPVHHLAGSDAGQSVVW